MTSEEILTEIGKQRKRVRRTSPENLNADVVNLDSDDDNDIEKLDLISSATTNCKSVVITKKIEQVPIVASRNDLLDRAIQAKRWQLKFLEDRGTQEDIERSNYLREELMELFVSAFV